MVCSDEQIGHEVARCIQREEKGEGVGLDSCGVPHKKISMSLRVGGQICSPGSVRTWDKEREVDLYNWRDSFETISAGRQHT